MKTARIHMHVEPELLREIDLVRGDVPRQVWIQRAVEERLQAKATSLSLCESESLSCRSGQG
jgi:hypothetical protein